MDSFGLYDAFLQGKKDFRRSSLYMIVAQLSATAMIALAVLLTHNLFVIVLAYFASWTIARFFLLRVTLRQYHPIDCADTPTLTYGKHLTLMNVLGTVAGYADRLLVFHFLGAMSLATYSFALSPVDQIRSVFKGIPTLALPKMSTRAAQDIDERLTSRLWALTLLGGIVALLYIVSAPYLFTHLFPNYLPAVLLSQIYAAGLILIGPTQLLTTSFQSKPHLLKAMYTNNVAGNAILILALVLFGYYWGVIGIMLARLLQYALTLLLALVLWYRKDIPTP